MSPVVQRNRQRGVAIVMAMGVIALAAMAATAIVVTQSTWARHNALKSDHVQAQLVVRAGEDWASAVLFEDRRLGNVDHLGEPWALQLPPMPIDNGKLAGIIEDQQARYNVNNLVKDGKVSLAQLAHFQRLLAILDLPADLADALADWIDADSEPQGNGEDGYYLALQTPYRAANRPLIDVAELALVRGFDDRARSRLAPFVTALPRFTAVNVNTAPPEVLAAIIDGIGLDGARALVAQRNRIYFQGSADFFNRLPRGMKVAAEDVTVASSYFLAVMRVNVGEAQAHGAALLARNDTGWPTAVWRKMP